MRLEKERKKVALFDIDGTMYRASDGFMVFPIAEAQAHAGLISKEIAGQMGRLRDDYKEGIASYPQMVGQVTELWAQGLKGKSAKEVVRHAENYLRKEGSSGFLPYVPAVIGMLRSTHDIFIITGGTQFTAEATLNIFNAKSFVSTEFEVDKKGLFTGRVAQKLASGGEKLEKIRDLVGKDHDWHDSFAFGDTESDQGMLGLVEYAICINPNSELMKKAIKENWPMFFTDLKSVSPELKCSNLELFHQIESLPNYVSEKIIFSNS